MFCAPILRRQQEDSEVPRLPERARPRSILQGARLATSNPRVQENREERCSSRRGEEPFYAGVGVQQRSDDHREVAAFLLLRKTDQVTPAGQGEWGIAPTYATPFVDSIQTILHVHAKARGLRPPSVSSSRMRWGARWRAADKIGP